MGIVFAGEDIGGELNDGASATVRDGVVVRGGLVGARGEFLDDGDVAGAFRFGYGDALDEVGHCHFNVKFDEVG